MAVKRTKSGYQLWWYDAEGKFRIDKEAQGPQLVQAFYAGVQYNKMVFPGAPATASMAARSRLPRGHFWKSVVLDLDRAHSLCVRTDRRKRQTA